MNYEEYAALAHRGAEISEKGDSAGAIAIFRRIVDSDLAKPDRVMMSLNIATLYANMQQVDQAVSWYRTAVELEAGYHGRQALESRAVYLAQIGRNRESLRDFEQLSQHPSLNEADKVRVRGFLQQMRARVGV